MSDAVQALIAEVLLSTCGSAGRLARGRFTDTVPTSWLVKLRDMAIAAQQEAASDVRLVGTPAQVEHVTEMVIPAAATGLGRAIKVRQVSTEGPEAVSSPDVAENRPSVEIDKLPWIEMREEPVPFQIVRSFPDPADYPVHQDYSRAIAAWSMARRRESEAEQERIRNHGTCE